MGLGIREISKLILLPLYKSILGSGFRSDSVIILSNKHANKNGAKTGMRM